MLISRGDLGFFFFLYKESKPRPSSTHHRDRRQQYTVVRVQSTQNSSYTRHLYFGKKKLYELKYTCLILNVKNNCGNEINYEDHPSLAIKIVSKCLPQCKVKVK